MNSRLVFLAFASVLFSSPVLAQDKKTDAHAKKIAELTKGLKDGLYTVIETNRGDLVFELYYEKTPSTVANFVGLATAQISSVDPKTKKSSKKRFYDGLTIHRLVKDFLMQGGCPKGTGTGGPGYMFSDELVPELKHEAGVISMARAKAVPDSNGSQFFVTLKPAPWLNGQNSVFGKIVKGWETLKKINKTPIIKGTERPSQKIIMLKVSIQRIGAKAKAWKISSVAEKSVPDVLDAQIDASRVWDPKSEQRKKTRLQFILIKWKDLNGVHPLCSYTEAEAKVIAQKIARAARVKGAKFVDLETKYSDAQTYGQTFPLKIGKAGFSESLKGAFTLKEGQVSDALKGPEGFMVFYCPKLLGARHILITYKDSEVGGSKRSKEEAQKLAAELHKKIIEKKISWGLAAKQSDDKESHLGDLGLFAESEMVSEFSAAVLKLRVGDISTVVETKFGFHIIQRTK
ncbi:MAG: peptidylprolyl isomerase [Planctomycetota bacterium]|nr:peptidylprolyl isomerase [Planctomycetota bacterium]